MFLLVDVCAKSGVLKAIYIIKQVLQIILILVPVVILITGIVSLGKTVINGDDKQIRDTANLLIKKFIVGTFISFLPLLVNNIIKLANEQIHNEYIECYTKATKENIEYYKALEEAEKAKKLAEKEKQLQANLKNYQDSNTNSNSGTSKSSIACTMYIGDSRTVGMYFTFYSGYSSEVSAFQGSDFWYASEGKGYSWFISNALPTIKSKLNSYDCNVTIQLGANDLGSPSTATSYVNQMTSLASNYPNSKFIIISVNPINDSKASSNGYLVRNSDVVSYNSKLKNSVNNSGKTNLVYCDTYSSIINSFGTTDGIHYDSSTYKAIYNSIKSCI